MTLKDYLNSHAETVDTFAAKVNASPGMIHKIVYRTRQPSLSLAAEIERESGGKVGALDMLLSVPTKPEQVRAA